jgi:hypothetical protein
MTDWECAVFELQHSGCFLQAVTEWFFDANPTNERGQRAGVRNVKGRRRAIEYQRLRAQPSFAIQFFQW